MSLEQAQQEQPGRTAQRCDPALHGVLILWTGAVARPGEVDLQAHCDLPLPRLALSQAGHLVSCCRAPGQLLQGATWAAFSKWC